MIKISRLIYVIGQGIIYYESVGTLVRGFHKPIITPVDLHRYLSLTVAVGELLVIQHGFPKDQWNH